MAIHVIKKCPKCNNTFEVGHHKIGIGTPFHICENCKNIIIDEDSTEWELKNLQQKIWFIFISCWTSILYGTIPLIIVGGINELNGKSITDEEFFYLYSIGLVFSTLFITKTLISDIKKSNERMKDERYRTILKNLGLLK